MLLVSSGYLVLVAAFGFSAAAKLRHPGEFARQVENYRLLPRGMSRRVAAAVALIEAGCALALLLPPTRLAGLVTAASLLGAFLIAMSLVLARGQRIPCGCFGGTGDLDTVGVPSLLRTALLGVLVVTSLQVRPTAVRPVQLLVAALTGLLVVLLAETARLLPVTRRPAGERA